ncbi:intracellular protease/amidase [Penicillium chermesinum]|uniref:D-lactate dehydratase n=1 Tax=Penicillium chermesinum TaxID=63820 RepID=A0A9W9NZ80_9EURO|nr:intracellular protease/amidase [Penicillium chermesinum]KAJ5232579.1 intracellular protease/amidase [Penicillium chermesinum]
MSSKSRILIVVTNVSHFSDPSEPTGLWLSELTHAWDVFKEHGAEMTIISPRGGRCPLDPRSLKFPTYDKSAKAWHTNPELMGLLETTAHAQSINPDNYDAIYFTGGHGVMFDFRESEDLQRITREIFERGGIVSSVCHGYCGLLDTKLHDGSYLISGRKVTGFSWAEERLAGVSGVVPYNVEEDTKKRGAQYKKRWLPFMSYTVVDRNLITGQNPGSARETALKVVTAIRGVPKRPEQNPGVDSTDKDLKDLEAKI